MLLQFLCYVADVNLSLQKLVSHLLFSFTQQFGSIVSVGNNSKKCDEDDGFAPYVVVKNVRIAAQLLNSNFKLYAASR